MSQVIEQRDVYTAGHQRRVAELSQAIGRKLQLDGHTITGLWLGASIHDIGKVHIPSDYIVKPARLSDAEFALIKEHPQVGYYIVKHEDFDWPVAEMI